MTVLILIMFLNAVCGVAATVAIADGMWVGLHDFLSEREVSRDGETLAYIILGQLWILVLVVKGIVLFVRGWRSLWKAVTWR